MTAAVILHGVIFAALVGVAVIEILVDGKRPKPKLRPKPPATVVEIGPEYFQRGPAAAAVVTPRVPEPVLPEPKPKAEPHQYARTSADQESEVAPDEPAFIGERDTLGASERAPDPDAPDTLPSQDGEQPRHANQQGTFDSDFTDGEEPGSKTTDTVQPEPMKGDAVDGPDGEGEPTEESEKAAEESGLPKERILDSPNTVDVPVEEKPDAEKKEETLPKESRSEAASEGAKKGEGGTADTPPQEQPKRSGFQTEQKKVRMRGSLSRRGKSSLDVQNTAVGRYQAQVSRALEREWQKKCMLYREHITPGILTIRFFIDQKGQVSHLRYIDQVESSEIQKGFTINAVRDANYPKMPKDVARELDGDPLELVISFLF